MEETIEVVLKRRVSAGSKKPATKTVYEEIYSDHKRWTVQYGELRRGKGRPSKTEHLFKVVGEKLPFKCLKSVRNKLKADGYSMQGVYIAHDSMGCPRYIGRGNIFTRLEARFKAQPLELEYFSFYVVSEKQHEREIETLMIRTAGFLLFFNDKKKRVGVEPGDVRDYEAGTVFFERQRKKGTVSSAASQTVDTRG